MADVVTFEIDLGSSEPANSPRPRRTPQCYECNRFCRILSEYYGYDGQGTQLYVTYDCTHCGVYTQGIW